MKMRGCHCWEIRSVSFHLLLLQLLCVGNLYQAFGIHTCQRMGLAPGFRAPWRMTAPLARQLQYGSQARLGEQSAQDLNKLLLTRVNHTGSDIRISTGDIMVPKAFPCQGVQADWWTWKPVFSFPWKKSEHINALELRSILQAVQYSLHHHKQVDARLFHISDSYICMSIISKGRSSSRFLNRILRVLNAYLLAHGIVLIIGHVESTQNPTDGASRQTKIPRSHYKN